MAATREDFIRMARDAVGGFNRPPSHCEATYNTPHGTIETVTVECEHTIRNPASYDPPEWVIDAMRAAYLRGQRDLRDTQIAEQMDRQSHEEAHGVRESGR